MFCDSFFFVADGLAKKFGLSPEHFGENLRDNYQRHEVEQEPTEPSDLAREYIGRYLFTLKNNVTSNRIRKKIID